MSKVVVSTKLLRGKHSPTIQRIMEISKSLQEEILSVQNKLKNAIRDHQVCVEKLKDDPDNTSVLDQIQQIQIYIVSLGRRQKQVVQRLRMEVETLKAENANGSKVSVASLLGLNNNNHIINNNEAKGESTDSKKLKDINSLDSIIKKEDYEEEIRNTDDSSPSQENDSSNRERSNSVESISYEDDVVEISADENSNEKQDMEEECSADSSMQVSFLGILGLITTTKSIELHNRKAERKRRRTANPQFVYSNWELPTKRRRHSYLQSAGKAPQTRQSTARSNEPSPPLGKTLANKYVPSTKNSSKTLISTQKIAAKPNILRNGSENKVSNKNGTENAQSLSNKSVGSKVVHIPGLPSSLTIERIEADSAICISCRNPGTLTVCQQCSSKYHISCHSISPPPSKICPTCALNSKENTGVVCKKENELAATAHTARVFGKAGEDSKVHKTSCGFHKINAASKRNFLPSTLGINQLPSSTYLIPISSNAMPVTDHTTIKNPTSINRTESSEFRIIDPYTHSGNVTFINKAEPQLPNPSCQIPNNSDKHQSYLIVKKVPESSNCSGRSNSRQNRTQSNTILNYQLSSPCGYRTTHGQPEMPLTQSSNPFNKITNRRSESNPSGGKKSNNRSLPGLNRIFSANNKRHRSDSSSSDEDDSHDKNLSRFGDLFYPLFSVNNKPDIIASSSGESQGTSADRTDYTNFWQFSQIQNSECHDRTEKLRSIEPSDSTEHVKLEEAHISAPSRTKLNINFTSRMKQINSKELNPHKKVNKLKQKLKNKASAKTVKNIRKVLTNAKVGTNNTNRKKNVIQPVMEVTLDDTDELGSESPEESSKETDKIVKNDDKSLPISLTNKSCQIFNDLQDFYTVVKGTLDFIISERKHTSYEISDLAKRALNESCIEKLQDNIIELHKEVSISDDKADSESQDLFSDNSRPLIIDEGNVRVIERINSNQSNASSLEIKETIIIDSVSSEKIELLEQFESAILNINQEIDG